MYLNIFNYVDITIFHTYFFLFYYALIVDSTFYDIMLHVAKTCIWIWIQLYLIENYKFHAPPLTPFTKNGSKNTIKKTGNGNRIIRAYLHGFLFCQWNMRSLKEKSGFYSRLDYFWLACKILPDEPAIQSTLSKNERTKRFGPTWTIIENFVACNLNNSVVVYSLHLYKSAQ